MRLYVLYSCLYPRVWLLVDILANHPPALELKKFSHGVGSMVMHVFSAQYSTVHTWSLVQS